MYALIHNLRSPAVTLREASTFAASLVLAEMFYKLHSFTLECVAFLATWAALSALVSLAGRLFHKPNTLNHDT